MFDVIEAESRGGNVVVEASGIDNDAVIRVISTNRFSLLTFLDGKFDSEGHVFLLGY